MKRQVINCLLNLVQDLNEDRSRVSTGIQASYFNFNQFIDCKKFVNLLLEAIDCFSQFLDIRIKFVRFPNESYSFTQYSLNFFLHSCHQKLSCWFVFNLFNGSLVRLHSLNERHSIRIELIRLMSFVNNCQRDSESPGSKVPHFFRQSNDLRSEVHSKLQLISSSSLLSNRLDMKDPSRNIQLSLLNRSRPFIKDDLSI